MTLGEQIEIYAHPAGSEASFGYDELAIEHLNLYLSARLYWNANQDIEMLLADYFNNYYGPAAEAMRAFVTHAEANWMLMSTDGSKIGESLALLDKAQGKVDANTLPGRRIAQIATIMKPMRSLQRQLSRKRDTDLSYRVLETHQTDGKEMKAKAFDGKVDRAWWGSYRTAPLLPLKSNATRSKATSSFQVLREGSVLYFGIICEEPDMKGNNISTTKNDDPKLFEGDHILLLIETPTRSQYEIAINPAGAIYDAIMLRAEWVRCGVVEFELPCIAVIIDGVLNCDYRLSVKMRLPWIHPKASPVLSRKTSFRGISTSVAFGSAKENRNVPLIHRRAKMSSAYLKNWRNYGANSLKGHGARQGRRGDDWYNRSDIAVRLQSKKVYSTLRQLMIYALIEFSDP